MGPATPPSGDKKSPSRRWIVIGVIAVGIVGAALLALRYASTRVVAERAASGTATEAATEEAIGPPEVELAAAERWRQRVGDQPVDRLNVILVTIDTVRADHLSCYGSETVETPNIDRLAAEGVRFTNTATTVPFTLPAHSSIMTGTYPPYHGVRENVGYFLDEDIPTIAELLAANGYYTTAFVSAFVLDARWGIARGFDNYFDDFDVASQRQINMASVQRDGGETVAETIRWLDQRPPGPFFLWLHLFDPHEPYAPPEPYLSRYSHPYDGEIAYTDDLIGEFRTALEERGLLANSLLVVTGDHGEGLGDHGEGYHGYFVYDSTVHVPLIIRAPFADLAGRVVTEPVSHVDLQPTILAAVGLGSPEGTQGASLIPSLLGMGGTRNRAVYTESYYPLFHYGWAPLRSIRTTRHKYIGVPRPELFDFIDDRREEQNLFDQRQSLAEDLEQRLTALLETLGREVESAAREPDLDEATLQQLQALGYVAGRGEISAEEEHDVERADPKDKIRIHQRITAAQSLISRGDDEAAERHLREVLAQDSGMLDAHQMLGNIAVKRQDYDGAVGHFRHALELDSDHRASLFGLADSYRRLGRLDEALLGFQRLQALSPHDSKAIVAMSDIYVEQNQLPAALNLFEEAAQLEDVPAMVHNKHGELLALLGRPHEAVAVFQRAIDSNDELPQPHYNLAVVYEELGQPDRAIEHYERAIESAPTHFQAQFNLGRIYGQRADLDRQQHLYEAAIESNPEFVRGYYFLAKLIMDRGGDLERVEQLAREGLERDPEHQAGPMGYFLLADVYHRLGRMAESQRELQRGRRIQAEKSGREGT
jgi:arylsulfatase A-like enzyme/Tfp pilus assembly protein PilF